MFTYAIFPLVLITSRVHIDSGVFTGGQPVPVGTQIKRLLKFVEPSQVTMGYRTVLDTGW
jgi:hypothetical protein